VLACQAANIWGVIQPDQQEAKSSINTIAHLIDIVYLTVNSTSQIVNDDGASFGCTNDPFMDYYNLTKSLNVLDIAAKVRALVAGFMLILVGGLYSSLIN
jgi:hypothetical protein